MPLQDISPINDQLADIIVRADEPWIELSWTSLDESLVGWTRNGTMGRPLPLEEGLRGLAS